MRWTKREKQAIVEQIREYERKISNTHYQVKCAFCKKFAFHECKDCPNVKITTILKIREEEDKFSCADNMVYFIHNFHLSERKQYKGFITNMQQLEFRCQMWQDSLDLTKREFVEKYKKEE